MFGSSKHDNFVSFESRKNTQNTVELADHPEAELPCSINLGPTVALKQADSQLRDFNTTLSKTTVLHNKEIVGRVARHTKTKAFLSPGSDEMYRKYIMKPAAVSGS